MLNVGQKVLINRCVENSRIRTRRVPAGTKKGLPDSLSRGLSTIHGHSGGYTTR